MEEINSKTHVLVLPCPAQGHINPIVQFSKILASKEVKVTILTIDFVCKAMLLDCGPLVNIESIPHEAIPVEGLDNFLEWFQTLMLEKFSGIVEKFGDSEYPVKVVVIDSIITWIIDLAHELGLKVAAFHTQPVALSALYYHIDQEDPTNKIPFDGSVPVSLPSLPLLEKEDLPSFISETDAYPTVKRLAFGQNFNFKKADSLLFNTFDALEEEVINWLRTLYSIKTIGPVVLSMYLDKEYDSSLTKPHYETCKKWLDSREIGSVIYVSFGSLASLVEKQMEELAFGLIMSNSYFLWVVRDTEENKLPNEFKSNASEKGLIVNWSPQLDVLAHKSVGCFFTHCGWNSTLEALSLGVPLVCMPQWADQPTNAKFISDIWRTGIRVKARKDGVVTREEIASSIKEVMVERKGVMLKENAIKWKKLAKEAVDKGGCSDKNIEEFIQACNALN
ncbi:PREDICTED: UDP-glycosyltransferase 74E2-like [Nicotiana attenuata]|uniref:Glycosyltransferase n=1 Tax=Nicotiana attenuata TaxID=49451 RepID=A0A314KLH9_NICAT|nr:PREDICTED: UDP-glycosyltransferase 74E2-like [Nicotiana attenuata]OIT30108.1 udp-glycosyltransferase 74e2 [Nicotiana attenuata]